MQGLNMRKNFGVLLVTALQVLALAYAVGYSENAEARRCRGGGCSTGGGPIMRMFQSCFGGGCRTQRQVRRSCRNCGGRQASRCSGRGCSTCSQRGGCGSCSQGGGCRTCTQGGGGCSTCGGGGQSCSTCGPNGCSTAGIAGTHGGAQAPFGGIEDLANRALSAPSQAVHSLSRNCNLPWQGQTAQLCLSNGAQQMPILFDQLTGQLMVAGLGGTPMALAAQFANPILADYRAAAARAAQAGQPVDEQIQLITQKNPTEIQDAQAPAVAQAEPTPAQPQPRTTASVSETGAQAPQQQPPQPQASGPQAQVLSSGGVPVKYYGYTPSGSGAGAAEAARLMLQDAATLIQILRNPRGTNGRIVFSQDNCGGCTTLHNILSGKGGNVNVSGINITDQNSLASGLRVGPGGAIYVIHLNALRDLEKLGGTELVNLIQANMPARVPATL